MSSNNFKELDCNKEFKTPERFEISQSVVMMKGNIFSKETLVFHMVILAITTLGYNVFFNTKLFLLVWLDTKKGKFLSYVYKLEKLNNNYVERYLKVRIFLFKIKFWNKY